MSTALLNPYWDAVKDHIKPDASLWGTPEVDWFKPNAPRRTDLVKLYSWTVTDPDTVAFVAQHAGPEMVDPMAGTGYWAWLLAQMGIDVVCYDLHAPGLDHERNTFHRNVAAHTLIAELPAVESVTLHPNRTLLLSWPPYGFEGATVLDAYEGDRVVYIGEGEFGCCGDSAMFERLGEIGEVLDEQDAATAPWRKVAEHVPVQWSGIHDVVHVYERRTS